MTITNKSDKMGTMPVGKLILTMSLPAIASMLVQALYNVVDSIFVSNIEFYGDAAASALSIAFPFQMLFMAFSLGIGVGVNSLVSKNLGAGERERANAISSTGLLLTVLNAAIFLVLGFTMAETVAKWFTSDETVIEFTTVYIKITVGLSVFSFIEVFVNKLNQAQSNMIIPMFTQLIGAITNIILDPIFIFGLFGIEAMGVKGAAVATVIGQAVAMAFCIITFIAQKQEIKINLKDVFKPKLKTIGEIYAIGIPTIILNAVSSFTIIVMNLILSASGIIILGYYFKLQSFVFMPIFGMNQGVLPILAYNYGRQSKVRFVSGYKIALISAFAIMVAGLLIFQLLSPYFLQMFGNLREDASLMKECVNAFRMISWCFLPAAIGIITTTMFQAIGRGVTSMIMSLLRQVALLLPIAYALKALFSESYLWLCYPISEVIVVLIFFPIAVKIINKIFKVEEK